MPTQFARDDIPPFIYGTAWKEQDTARLTKLALDNGFRGIDTANQRKHYHEAGVGEAIAEALDEGIVEREELFVQTKFTYRAGQDHRLPYDPDASFATQVEQSFEGSLEHLQTDYVDSYVLHGPSTRSGLSEADHQVWAAMEQLARSSRARALGVSNVSADQLAALIEWADVAPAFVQNRCFARTGWDAEVRQICDQNDITYQGFSLLTANRRELSSPELSAVAERHDKTVAQIVFRFAIDAGMLPLTGTTNPEHMRQDLACLEFELDKTEVATIERIAAL